MRSAFHFTGTPVFFDALYLDGQPLVDEPLTRRVSLLAEQSALPNLVARIVTADADVAAASVVHSANSLGASNARGNHAG